MKIFPIIALTLSVISTALLAAPHGMDRTAQAQAARLLEGAEIAIANGNDRRAEQYLSNIPQGSLDADGLARLQIIRARIGLVRNNPSTVLRALPSSSKHVPEYAPNIELLRGQAYFLRGEPVYAVRSLINREQYLRDPRQIAENHDQIWNGLIATPIGIEAVTKLGSEGPLTRGWLELAVILQDGPTQAAIADWSRRHPGHPGAAKALLIQTQSGATTAVGTAAHGEYPAGRGYAVLIPTSGYLATAGEAIREGFVSAWFDQRAPRLPIRFYDTGSNPELAVQAFRQALRDGADFIIGPLAQQNIAAISRTVGTMLPWIPLNQIDDAPQSAVQFGLGPEDEAYAAARDAIAQGYRSALILAPANDWGNRAADSFTQLFTSEGGRVRSSERYPTAQTELTRPLMQLFSIRSSEQRHRELVQILGVRSEFEPQPRNDADVLFAPLRAREAHTLLPKLDFLKISNITTYMLSAAHNGVMGSHLSGVRLCDMPWVIHRTGHWAELRRRAANDFPEAMLAQPRLFALGADAFRISSAMRSSREFNREIDGASGRLRIVGGKVERELRCLSMQGGSDL